MAYRGVDILAAGSPAPWGTQENTNWKASLDALMIDTLYPNGTSDTFTAGHKHAKTYDELGALMVQGKTGKVGLLTTSAWQRVSLQFTENAGVDSLSLKNLAGTEVSFIDSLGAIAGSKLLHAGDTDTYLVFSTNTISLYTANAQRYNVTSGGSHQFLLPDADGTSYLSCYDSAVRAIMTMGSNGKLSLLGEDNSATVKTLLELKRTQTGTGGVGLGSAIDFYTEEYNESSLDRSARIISDFASGGYNNYRLIFQTADTARLTLSAEGGAVFTLPLTTTYKAASGKHAPLIVDENGVVSKGSDY